MNPPDVEIRPQLAALLPRLRRFGRMLTRHREDADDLVQVAIERALQRAQQWEPGTRLDSWMFRIMQNAWIDEKRSRDRRGEVLIDQDGLDTYADVAGPDDPAMRVAVRSAVSRLSDEHRAVVGLVLVEGLSYQEAAQVLDVPMGTVTSRLARAREALQQQLSLSGGTLG